MVRSTPHQTMGMSGVGGVWKRPLQRCGTIGGIVSELLPRSGADK